ncbi:RNA polymerase sigma-70 factor (family 1) [Catalinimonas alkaloidigena]|uniref:RNA polymerase sigma factor n=1 Tax=Catalinimonas alkaloidigena TaxID=1075417 RepID=UPI002405C7C9|nr:RNA polymerase sigma-70 factor [Catalinimonas alkaloidigena]MDF9798890.1 RNA polymerase sigma-70 factor (family 1) [Catalinimonas alkaloidigena]
MSVLRKKNEEKLIKQLKAGDKNAFKVLFEQYKNTVYKYGYLVTRSQMTAEETVQEVFMKIWQNRKQLDSGRSFKPYLFTVTKHHVYNLLRKATNDEKLKAQVYYQQDYICHATENQIAYHELEKLQNEIIAMLPTQRQRIFRMSRMQGLSHKEIAQQLGISTNTVKDQIVKATKTLKEYFRTHADVAMLLVCCNHLFL